ncbi:MAG: protein phosphatase 2C domain-containing protein [Actinomycetota bacterium]|nr:protein phosphatase 2C domain-containing protein [Actinomycetota bacterium]
MNAGGAVRTEGWTGVSASVRGSQHVRTGLVNQDAVQVVALDAGVPLSVAAVADGHGGVRYVRSDVGSKLAVSIACRLGADAGRSLGAAPTVAAAQAHLRTQFVDALIEQWRAAVFDHVATHPFTADESVTAGVELVDADPLIAYGCTLLVSVLAPEWVAFVQIGDGDVVTVDRDGRATAPVPGDARLVGGETTSLCLPTARTDARIAVSVPPPEMVLLASDGYGNSFASPAWMQETGSGFAEILRTSGLDDIIDRLPGWLAESAEAGGDDVTVALMVHGATPARGFLDGRSAGSAIVTPPAASGRADAPATGPVGAVAASAAGSSGVRASAPPSGAGAAPAPRRRGALIALVLAGVLIGAAAGWFAAAGTSESTTTTTAPAEPTEQPTTSTTVATPGQSPVVTAEVPGADGPASIVAPPFLLPGVQVIEFDPAAGADATPTRVARLDGATVRPVSALFAGGALWTIQEGTGRLRRQESPDGGPRNVSLKGEAVGGLAAAGNRVWVVRADGTALAAVTFDGQLDGGWQPVIDARDGEWLQPGEDSGN